ncbi:hemolysin III family protein [Zobellella sp. DQSA1]|uniref:PAQR family membrane homeostasis protein TrhA n=1 Tax=Zobellella sp. DQSA1 TaxID=3342386 RepID=UPI0035C18DD1
MNNGVVTPRREQSGGEEMANSISHGIGLVAALAGTPVLLVRAVRHGDTGFTIGVVLFALSMILLYLASTLYHALPPGKAKCRLRMIEHAAIFVLIAGTYSPFTLGILSGPWGWSLLVIIWGLALFGITLKLGWRMNSPLNSTGLYLIMGWLIVIATLPLYERMPLAGLALLVAGGVAYTAGVVFFTLDARWRYGHLVWHLFVMVGTGCHYFAVLWHGA